MKIPWPAILFLRFLVGLSLPALGQETQETNHQIFLTGFFNGSSPDSHDYLIDLDRLPGKISWEPGKEPFPLALDAEVTRASSFLVQQKGITNRLDLGRVLIRHAIFRSSDASETGNLPGFTNTWIVVLEFLEQAQNRLAFDLERVVMLLDGTYASESIRKKSGDEWAATQPKLPSAAPLTVIPADTRPAKSRRSPARANPFELVRRSDFRVPEVQWLPDHSFPLDLNVEVARMYNCLVQTNHMPEEFTLLGIEITRYHPDGAVRDVGSLLFKHSGHWIVECSYGPKPVRDLANQYRTYALLDGRILSVTTPDEQISNE